MLISLTDCIEGSSMFFLYGKVGMTIWSKLNVKKKLSRQFFVSLSFEIFILIKDQRVFSIAFKAAYSRE